LELEREQILEEHLAGVDHIVGLCDGRRATGAVVLLLVAPARGREGHERQTECNRRSRVYSQLSPAGWVQRRPLAHTGNLAIRCGR
jgi:hypothetical protein